MHTSEQARGDIFATKSHNPSFYTIRSRAGHAGELLDFCVPVNPYFPPPQLTEMLRANLPEILKYYPDYAETHQQSLAALTGLPADNIVVGNGSTEIITSLCRDLKGPLVTSIPTFGRWTDLPVEFGAAMHGIERRAENGFRITVDEIVQRAAQVRACAAVVCNPNNPTGAWLSSQEIARLLQALAHLPLVVIDESFIDFSDLESAAALAIESPNAVVVKSMGKALGWHGIRLGYAVASTPVAAALRTRMPYWNVNGLAAFVLKNLGRFRESYAQSFQKAARDRDYMFGALRAIEGLKTYPSQANFLYCELAPGVSGRQLRDRLLDEYGIVIRECSNKAGSTERYLRLAVHRRDATDRLVQALRALLPTLGPLGPRPPAHAGP